MHVVKYAKNGPVSSTATAFLNLVLLSQKKTLDRLEINFSGILLGSRRVVLGWVKPASRYEEKVQNLDETLKVDDLFLGRLAHVFVLLVE